MTSDGEFSDPGDRELQQGNQRNLVKYGDVFRRPNKHINPHFSSFSPWNNSLPVDEEDELEHEDDTNEIDGAGGGTGIAFRL